MKIRIYCYECCSHNSSKGSFCREVAIEGASSIYECEYCSKQYIITEN